MLGATNAFNDKVNCIKNQQTGIYNEIPIIANEYRENNISSIIIGDENYGEGSSREHAAMEPRFVGVRVVLVKSFARIHETNLKKQGILALTFKEKNDYDLILEDDSISLRNLNNFKPGKNIFLDITRPDGEKCSIETLHTYNENQIDWFKAGSSLNLISLNNQI